MNSKCSPGLRFLIRLALFLSIQAVIAGIVVRYGSPHDSNHYLGAMQDKLVRLERCRGNRLMIVGGSNVAFGIHSEELQKATGLETVNLGLHAGLGLKYAIECARQHAREGDIVVLVLEYELLVGNILYGDPKMVNQMMEQFPAAARYFDQNHVGGWKQFLDRDALCQAHQWVNRAQDRIRRRDNPDNIYQRSSFNSYGDVVAHYGREDVERKFAPTFPEVDAERFDEAVEILNEFASECCDRQVTVYLTFPPLPESLYAASTDDVNHIEETVRSRLRIPVLHRPQDFVFPTDHFFDTNYHLSEAAGAKRTRAIATALRGQADFETRISQRSERTASENADPDPTRL